MRSKRKVFVLVAIHKKLGMLQSVKTTTSLVLPFLQIFISTPKTKAEEKSL